MDLILFFGVLLLLIFVGLSKRVSSNAAYLFAERQTSFLALTATLVMTEFNTGTLIAFSSMGYIAGLWALTLPLVFLVGLLFYAWVVAKKWKEYDGSSVAGFFTQKYGKGIGRTAAILLTIAMIGFSAVYVKSLTLLFLPLVPQNPWLLSSILIGVIFAMSLRGGLVAIIRTDLLSFFLVLFFFPFIAIWMGQKGLSTEFTKQALPPSFVFSLIVLTMFTYILAPWYGQKIFAAKNTRVAFWSVFCAAILVFLLYGSAIVATAGFRNWGIACEAQEALPTLIRHTLPNGLAGFAYALLFATSATTLTGVWNALTSLWGSSTTKRSVQMTCGFALLSFILANTLVNQVFDKMILANIPVAALAFSLLAGFYFKRVSRLAAWLSIATGILGGALAYLFFREVYTLIWAFGVIPLSFLIGLISQNMRIWHKISGKYANLAYFSDKIR